MAEGRKGRAASTWASPRPAPAKLYALTREGEERLQAEGEERLQASERKGSGRSQGPT